MKHSHILARLILAKNSSLHNPGLEETDSSADLDVADRAVVDEAEYEHIDPSRVEHEESHRTEAVSYTHLRAHET